MNIPQIHSFLEKLIDWKEFELFVADLYSESDELIVEHDVTEIGKSGAKRQLDVKVTQKTKLHSYITVIECKRWKKKVTRQVIDVLVASVEDLNANKGAIFTTKGYEDGAIKYAKSKNIDIFLIRDINGEEWGAPGRYITLYLQFFSGKFENFVPHMRYISPTNSPPKNTFKGFNILFTKEQEYPPHLQLVSLNGKQGLNFIKLLIEIRKTILLDTQKKFNGLLHPENINQEIAYKAKTTLDFSKYECRFLKMGEGFLIIDKMECDFTQIISQSKMEIDRAHSADFALIVENYISNQKNYISKRKNEEKLKLSEPIKKQKEVDESKLLKSNSVIKMLTEHYVSCDLQKSTVVQKIKDLTINIE